MISVVISSSATMPAKRLIVVTKGSTNAFRPGNGIPFRRAASDAPLIRRIPTPIPKSWNLRRTKPGALVSARPLLIKLRHALIVFIIKWVLSNLLVDKVVLLLFLMRFLI